MVSFYRPTKAKYKIVIESDAFPSDRYAVQSQLKISRFFSKMTLLNGNQEKDEVLLRY